MADFSLLAVAVEHGAAAAVHGAEHAEPMAFGFVTPGMWVALAMSVLIGIMVWKKVPTLITSGLDSSIAQIRKQLDEAKAPKSERPRYKREGGSDNATTYGQMKTRECNVCGSRAKHSGKPWPTCGHGDWSWVEQQSARDEYVAHPTVKPLSLMRWLVRLVTPPGGTVLEPFAGSGTTVEACIVEGFDCIAIEREADYLPLIRQRIDRRRDPVEALRGQAADLGLFDLLGGEGA